MANNRRRSGYDSGGEDDLDYRHETGSPASSSLFNPEHVKNFILGVGQGGSLTALVGILLQPLAGTLSDRYTPEIMEWIDEHAHFAPLVYIPAIIWSLLTYVAKNIQELWGMAHVLRNGVGEH